MGLGWVWVMAFDLAFRDVFRSEKSFTHRHMTEFVGLDLEMTFKVRPRPAGLRKRGMDNEHDIISE